MTDRTTELETKIAFLERTLDAHHEVLLDQGRELERLEERLRRLERRQAEAGTEDVPRPTLEDDRPPHY